MAYSSHTFRNVPKEALFEDAVYGMDVVNVHAEDLDERIKQQTESI